MESKATWNEINQADPKCSGHGVGEERRSATPVGQISANWRRLATIASKVKTAGWVGPGGRKWPGRWAAT